MEVRLVDASACVQTSTRPSRTLEHKASILIVDDEHANCDSLGEIFDALGFAVRIALGGAEALEAVAHATPDAVLLDISMPSMDGFEVLSRLRAEHPPTRLPIIMLTGIGEGEHIVEALRRGANDYITKPIDVPVVVARLRAHLSLKSAIDQIIDLEHDLERKNEQLQRANHDLGAAYRRIKSDLESAARVQQALLPSSPPDAPGFGFAWRYKPCQELAGDSLNVFALDDDHVGCYLLDVTGHGVQAALLSVTISRLLTPVPDQPSLVRRRDGAAGLTPVSPRIVAEELNARFQLDPETCQFFTLFYGLLNVRTRELRYVCAGQAGPVLAPQRGDVRNLNQPEIAIGVVPDPGYHERRLQLCDGDRLYLYSDGIDEARDTRRRLFGNERALRIIADARLVTLNESLDRLVSAAERWAGSSLDDDVSALAIEAQRS